MYIEERKKRERRLFNERKIQEALMMNMFVDNLREEIKQQEKKDQNDDDDWSLDQLFEDMNQPEEKSEEEATTDEEN